MGSPIPVVASTTGAESGAPDGAIPVALYFDNPATNAVVAALIAAGFGTSGQVLATNSTADGFEWVAN